jgi:hypothetical protein
VAWVGVFGWLPASTIKPASRPRNPGDKPRGMVTGFPQIRDDSRCCRWAAFGALTCDLAAARRPDLLDMRCLYSEKSEMVFFRV